MRVALGLSGGIDSSHAARMLLEMGYEVLGLTIQTDQNNSMSEAIEKASAVAHKLGIEHHVYDVQTQFKNSVIHSFQNNYLHGKTPNPCITCNVSVKFPSLLDFAKQKECERIATGHYADIAQFNDIFLVKRGADSTKDQSYFLSRLPQEILSKTLFPLSKTLKGDLFQEDSVPESEDICFLHNKTMANYFDENLPGQKEAKLITKDGSYAGKGLPITHYTPGQRKGLGLAKGPWYVDTIDAEHNAVIITREPPEHKKFIVSAITSGYSLQELVEKTKTVQVRYRSCDKPAKLTIVNNKCLEVSFCDNFSEAIAPGQTAAFYNGDVVLGGGEIARVID